MKDIDEKYLEYLDELRESGAVNMFGARSFLRGEFPEVDEQQSGLILAYWMKTFSERNIERVEKETGQRIDSNDGDNNAVAGLFGAISRILGQSPLSYTERDDVVVGLLMSTKKNKKKDR